jgi:glycerol-3-phosphate dehydrogenase
MKIAIIGLGFFGRSIAQASAGACHSVVGFATKPDVISSLQISCDFLDTFDSELLC